METLEEKIRLSDEKIKKLEKKIIDDNNSIFVAKHILVLQPSIFFVSMVIGALMSTFGGISIIIGAIYGLFGGSALCGAMTLISYRFLAQYKKNISNYIQEKETEEETKKNYEKELEEQKKLKEEKTNRKQIVLGISLAQLLDFEDEKTSEPEVKSLILKPTKIK